MNLEKRQLTDVTNCNTYRQDIDLVKEEIDKIIEEETRGSIIRSRARWYEEGEKSTKYFLNLEKRNFNKKSYE